MFKKLFLCAFSIILVSCTSDNSSYDIVSSELIIDTTVQTHAVNVEMGAQMDDWAAFDSLNLAPLLNELQPKYFRVHAGDDQNNLPQSATVGARPAWDFFNMDYMVNAGHEAGAKIILNIRHAPNSLWTCLSFHEQTGTLTDPSFNEFGDYMARLVAYYNLGSFQDEFGMTHTNPKGTSRRVDYWELWNEPDLFYEFNCLPATATPLWTPSQFTSMWTTVVAKMKAVDPTIQFPGATLSDPRVTTYLSNLINAGQNPDVVSVHSYLAQLNATDLEYYDGGGYNVGINGLMDALTLNDSVLNTAGLTSTPIWIDEFNMSAAGEDDPYERGWNHFSVGYGAATFVRMANLNLSRTLALIPFQFIEPGAERLTDINWRTGEPKIPYWRNYFLGRHFGATKQMLQLNQTGHATDAIAIRDSSTTVKILIANARPTKANVMGGRGPTLKTKINLTGLSSSIQSIVSHTIDSSTDPAKGPKPVTLTPSSSNTVDIQINGYGMVVLEIQL